jgi:small neutral amino acid transporter SnatA (MarC family)
MDPSEYFILILFAILGFISTMAAIMDAEWYFETNAARFFVRHLGRKGARVFYFFLGILLMGCGVLGFVFWE